jgi:hypothetical protein
MALPRPVSFLLLFTLLMPALAHAERGDRILELPLHGSGGEGLQATGEVYRRYVSPPPGLLETLEPQRRVASFQVNYNPGSCPDGTTTPWTQQARDAFSYAVSIWAAILNSSVTIEIDACWRNDLPVNTLGSAGASAFASDFDNTPAASIRFPIALANQIAGEDLNGTDVEIDARFNSNFTWYFGTDGNTPAPEVDFVTVVLHEIGHGLGFSGGANYDDGTDNAECNGIAGNGCIGSPARRFDQFIDDVNGTSVLKYFSSELHLTFDRAGQCDDQRQSLLGQHHRQPLQWRATRGALCTDDVGSRIELLASGAGVQWHRARSDDLRTEQRRGNSLPRSSHTWNPAGPGLGHPEHHYRDR